MSGRHSGMGLEERDGVAMAVDEINNAGGVGGREFSVVYEDDCNDPETARQVVSRFLADDVDVIIGHMISVMTLATVDLLEGTDVAMISPSTSTELLTGINDNFFRLVEKSSTQTYYLADYARNTLGLSRMNTIYDRRNEAFARGWVETMEKVFEEYGGQVIHRISYDMEEGDRYVDLATELLKDDPDAIAFAVGSIDAALICQQIRRYDDSIKFLMSGWSQTEDMISHGGSAVEGALFSDMCSSESQDPDFLRFRESFLDRYGYEPSFQGVNSYETVLLIKETLENAQKGESFIESLKRIRYLKGLQGDILIDEYGDVTKGYTITAVQAGRFVNQEE